MVLSYDLTSEIFYRIKIGTTLPPPETGATGIYNFGPMSMKFCMEVTFGEIQLKRHKVSRPSLVLFRFPLGYI